MNKQFIFMIHGVETSINQCSQDDLKYNPVQFRIINISDFKDGQPIQKVGVAINSKQLGFFKELKGQPQLPIGTEGLANILPALNTQVTAFLTKNNSGVHIGVANQYDFQYKNFKKGKVYQLTIDFIPDNSKPNAYLNPTPQNQKVPVVKIGDEIIGELKKTAISILDKLGLYRQGSTFEAILTRGTPYTSVKNLEIIPTSIPCTIIAPKLGRVISNAASFNSVSQDILIEQVESHYWHHTKWSGDVVELNICDSDLPAYEGYYPVKVYNKVLGLIPKNTPNLPESKIFTACLITDNECVRAILIDEIEEPNKATQEYVRPSWEKQLIKLARRLGINTEIKNNNLQVTKLCDYTFIYSEKTETLYLILSGKTIGKLYQTRRFQPASICNLS